MNCSVTLTADEFRKLHNALYYLGNVDNEVVTKQVEDIREALAGAYEQERQDHERRSSHYDQIRTELGLSAIWSVTEVPNLNESFPFKDVETITYEAHWGPGGAVVKPVTGNTWSALFVAANAAIRDSGDEHHIFIEDFRQVGNTLHLHTGS